MNNLILTGVNGFVGSNILKNILYSGKFNNLSVVVRSESSFKLSNFPDFGLTYNIFKVDDISAKTNWSNVLSNQSVVIHCAAIAHSVNHDYKLSIDDYRSVNTEGTINLARQAADAGVKRFIFLSSLGVHGIYSKVPFSINDAPAPVENYSISKLEAEIGLRKIAEEAGMEVVIIRPPLIYGPDAPGNFRRLMELACKNLPLPLGAIHNKRSMVSIDNLVDLVVTCIDHANASNQTFLVSDDYDVSTTELLRTILSAAGLHSRLIPVPLGILRFLGIITGKLALVDRLCSTLQVDISHTKNSLGWIPPVSFHDGIQKCFQKELKND